MHGDMKAVLSWQQEPFIEGALSGKDFFFRPPQANGIAVSRAVSSRISQGLLAHERWIALSSDHEVPALAGAARRPKTLAWRV